MWAKTTILTPSRENKTRIFTPLKVVVSVATACETAGLVNHGSPGEANLPKTRLCRE